VPQIIHNPIAIQFLMKNLFTLIAAFLSLAAVLGAQQQVPSGKDQAPTAQEAKPANPSESLSQLRQKAKPYKIGSKINPKLNFKGLNGKKLTMAQLRGKTVILAWYSMTCPVMKPSLPKLLQLNSDLASENLVVIGVNSNAHELADAKLRKDKDGKPLKPYQKLRKHVKKNKVNFMVCTDPGNFIADLFNARTTPHMFVIDPEGVLRYSGALDDDPKSLKQFSQRNSYVREAVVAIQNKQPVATPKTKPYGCSIKRVPTSKSKPAAGKSVKPSKPKVDGN
jgi:peroxiredoxin